METSKRTISCILDVDPGHDDAVAMLLAYASPAIELEAILTVSGNQIESKTTQNALKIGSLGEINCPIYRGMEGPMVRKLFTGDFIHGETGLDGAELPLTKEVEKEHAVWFLTHVLPTFKQPVTMIITGPMTNLAMALRINPSIRHHIENIVFMGGAYGLGNATSSAEFNIYADPEAAQIILQSGIPFSMIGLDVTHQALITDKVMERFAEVGSGIGTVMVPLLNFFKSRYDEVFHFDYAPLHDPIAVAYVIDPTIIETADAFVEVETMPGICYGRTVCDLEGVSRRTANGKVGIKLDTERFWELLFDTLMNHYGRVDER